MIDDTEAAWSDLNEVCASVERTSASHRVVVLIELTPPWWSLVPGDEGSPVSEVTWEVLRDHRRALAERAKMVCREFGVGPRSVVHDSDDLVRDVALWRRSGAVIIDIRARPAKSGIRRLLRALRGMVR
ncbi:hypothetical protein QRX50_29690 [Amycolatopsis carbonis]|uniref:Uncharacterized protein n=1 Tax=Amycolatopsis carbonis TaxID=715471 RepID=A0A9Y2IAQ5_9PSEU|nr:hypothetical protein [Amycolatopsis sp. 2-15]WIX75660.1 hypothetical protein QRX50_29690 [Amycolatopsis sp. 2-15]